LFITGVTLKTNAKSKITRMLKLQAIYECNKEKKKKEEKNNSNDNTNGRLIILSI